MDEKNHWFALGLFLFNTVMQHANNLHLSMSINCASICYSTIQFCYSKFGNRLLFSLISLFISSIVVISAILYFSFINLFHHLNHPQDKLSCSQLAILFSTNYQNIIFESHLFLKVSLQHAQVHFRIVCLWVFIEVSLQVYF